MAARHLSKNFFLEQWHRVLRWYRRCIEMEQTNSPEFHDILDFYLAYFCNVSHFKDWLIEWMKEKKEEIMLEELKKSMDKEKSISQIQDICNATKHFKLSKGKSKGKTLLLPREYDHFTQKTFLNVLIDGKKIRLETLSKDALSFWRTFLLKWNLLDLEYSIDADSPFTSPGQKEE